MSEQEAKQNAAEMLEKALAILVIILGILGLVVEVLPKIIDIVRALENNHVPSGAEGSPPSALSKQRDQNTEQQAAAQL